MLIDSICLQCSQNFKVEQREIKRGNGLFCSRRCFHLQRKKNYKPRQPNVECALCKKPFYKTKFRQSKSHSGLYFCCRSHKDEAQRIGGFPEIQPPHYGKTLAGYRVTAFRNLPHLCNKCGWNKLEQVLVVHHIDGDRSNNQLSNLEILCPNCHWEYHITHLSSVRDEGIEPSTSAV